MSCMGINFKWAISTLASMLFCEILMVWCLQKLYNSEFFGKSNLSHISRLN
jgi:hypothetical protein